MSEYSFSAATRGRRKGGFPDWGKVDLWLDPSVEAKYPSPVKTARAEIKNPELPVLDSYEEGASDSFWKRAKGLCQRKLLQK